METEKKKDQPKYSDDRGTNLLKNKTFWTRTLSGVIIVGILVAAFIIGSYVMWGLLYVLSMIGLYEFNKALKLNWGVFAWTGYIANTIYYVFILIFKSAGNYVLVLLGVVLVMDLAVFVFTYPRYTLQQVFAGFFEVFYIGMTLSFMYLLRIHPPSGAYLVWLVIISAWGCDIFAYLIGMLFGKHQFVPRLSPKKSVEGAIGGLAGAVVLAVVYGFIVQKYIPDVTAAPFAFGVITLFAAAAGMIGDLAASAIKRKVEIKDYGTIIPGHGGVLDRFDSVFMVAPIIYIITIWINVA